MITLPKPLRALSATQISLLGILLLLGTFLLIGSLQTNNTPSSVPDQPFFILAILAFGGGLLSFLSPCTLPILPAYFAFAFQSGRTQIATNTISFMLGVATMFSLLGATASVIGGVLRNSADLLLILGGALIILFGVMNLLGKGFSGFQSQNTGTQSATLLGSYGFGLTFAVGWSSCVGPILGIMLIMASTTGSVIQGVLLLFIYTLGLGLPLIVISTFLGRTSRQSLFWRLLRGKGWDWTTHRLVVGIVWGLAIWRILAAGATYLVTRPDPLATLTIGQELGLLVLVFIGIALWVFTQTGDKQITLNLHSTQLISGSLFILLGVLMLNGSLANFNTLVTTDVAIWFASYEERFKDSFEHRFEIVATKTPVSSDASMAPLTVDVITKKGVFQSGEWSDPVKFAIRERTLNEGIAVQFTNVGTLTDNPLETILTPPNQLSLEVTFLANIESGTHLFTMTGLGGPRFDSVDFGYICEEGGCYIGEIDLDEIDETAR